MPRNATSTTLDVSVDAKPALSSPTPKHDWPTPTKPSTRPRTTPDRPTTSGPQHGTNLAAARRNNDSHDQIERWNYLPERVEAAEQRIDALDGWRDWAEGKAVTDGTIIEVVHGLSAQARTDGNGAHAALAGAIHRWAQTKGLDLSRQAPAIERAGIDIDI